LHEAFTILGDEIDNPRPGTSIATPGPCSQHSQRIRTAGNNQSKIGSENFKLNEYEMFHNLCILQQKSKRFLFT